MIVPMKKLSIVVLEKERRQALKTLRKLGVVHVEEVKGESEELSAFKSKSSKIDLAVSLLSEIKSKKKLEPVPLSKDEAFTLADKVIGLTKTSCSVFPNGERLYRRTLNFWQRRAFIFHCMKFLRQNTIPLMRRSILFWSMQIRSFPGFL